MKLNKTIYNKKKIKQTKTEWMNETKQNKTKQNKTSSMYMKPINS